MRCDITVVLINGAAFSKQSVEVSEEYGWLRIEEDTGDFSKIPMTSILYIDVIPKEF